MATLRLSEKYVNILLEWPETGMGYQIVNVFLRTGRVLRKHKVLNSEILLLEPDERINEADIEKIEPGN